jgi:hypothetical protein
MVSRRDTRCGEKQAPKAGGVPSCGNLISFIAIGYFEERERPKLAREIAENLQPELDLAEWAIKLERYCNLGLGRRSFLLMFKDVNYLGSASDADIYHQSCETSFRAESDFQAIGTSLDIGIGPVHDPPDIT